MVNLNCTTFLPSLIRNLYAIAVLCTGICAILMVPGCTLTENPALVNAGVGTDSVRIQFINFAFDGQPRVLTLEGGASTQSTSFAGISDIISASTDSSRASIARSASGAADYQTFSRVRFVRNSFQTIIALPTANRIGVFGRDVDTLITFSSPFRPITNTNFTAQVRLINCMPDSTTSFSVRLGCPNGTQVLPPTPYRGVALFADIPAGNVVCAVIKHRGAAVETLEVDSTTLEPYKAYALLVYRTAQGRERAMLIDERGREQALRPLASIAQPFTLVRGVNISTKTVSMARGASTIALNLAPNSIAPVQSLSACAGTGADTIKFRGTGFSIEQLTSLAPLQRSTLLALDSAQSVSAMIVPPLPANISFAGSSGAIVRVVNAMQMRTVDVALAGRMTSSGFSSGITLQSNSPFQALSMPMLVEAGHAPIVVFTTAQPARMLFAGATTFQAGKQYIMVVSGDSLVRRITIIDEDTRIQTLSNIQRGTLLQVVNGIEPTEQSATQAFTIQMTGSAPLLQNTPLLYGNSFATVLPTGSCRVSAGNSAITFNSNTFERVLVVASGQANTPDMQSYTFNNDFLTTPAPTVMLRRFIHSARDVGTMVVSTDSVGGTSATEVPTDFPLRYRSATAWRPDSRELRRTFVFWEQNTRRRIKRIENIRLQVGRNYSVIVIGRNQVVAQDSTAGYDIMFVQEY
jgi:hypothetical protein